MIIKRHKRSFSLGIAILITVAIFFLTYDVSKLRQEKWTLMDEVMSMNLGVSHYPKLTELGDYLLNNSFRALKNIITGFPERPEINRMDIDIKLLEFNKILADREKAVEDINLFFHQKVNAKIRYKNTTLKAKIRLKGKSLDHWRSKTRMSLRVNLKGKNTIEGFKKFSLHKPSSRQFPYENVFQKLSKGLGNLGSVHKFIHVFVNGKDWGIMDMQEHISREMLEKQKVKDSIVVYLGSRYLYQYALNAPEVYENYYFYDGHLNVDVFSSKKYLKSLVNRKYLSYIIKESAKTNRQNILDKLAFSKAIVAFMIWNNAHSLANVNCRFYFNPYILKLQPIMTDQGPFYPRKEHKALLPKIFLETLDTKEVVEQFKQASQSIILNEKNINKIIRDIVRYFPNDQAIDFSTIFSHLRQFKLNPEKYVSDFINEMPMEDLKITPPVSVNNRSSRIMSDQIAKDILTHVVVNHFDDGTLHISNLLDVKIDLIGIYLDGKKLAIDSMVVPPYELEKGLLIVKTKYKGIMDKRFSVMTDLLGYKRTQTSGHTLFRDTYNPLQEKPKPFPSFVESYENGYKIKPGDWLITSPLIVNGNLTISPGTRLNFSSNSYLIVKGALFARGKPNFKIQLGPIKDEWKGLYVVRAKERSILENVNINKTTGLIDGLLNLSGGITFYQSDVSIANIAINGTKAEDALNIVGSKFTISNSKIVNTRSDALDSDFAMGVISDSIFSNIGGDAIDFSGGSNKVHNVKIMNVRDKGVSAGEGSVISLSNLSMSEVGVGIAAKDGSNVNANDLDIRDYRLHAVMSYVKKDFYGLPSISIERITQNGLDPFSRQNGSTMTIDGQEILEKNFDVKVLYNSETMRK